MSVTGTAVGLMDALPILILSMGSGFFLSMSLDNSKKNKFKAFFQFVLSVICIGFAYVMLTKGKTIKNYRSNVSNWQAARAAKLGPTTNVPAPAGVAAPPPMAAPIAA